MGRRDSDEDYLTPRQQQNKNRKKSQKKENTSKKSSKSSKTDNGTDSDNDEFFNATQRKRRQQNDPCSTPTKKTTRKRTSSNSSATTSVADTPTRRNPSRRARENSVASNRSYNEMEGSEEDEIASQPAEQETPFKTPRSRTRNKVVTKAPTTKSPSTPSKRKRNETLTSDDGETDCDEDFLTTRKKLDNEKVARRKIGSTKKAVRRSSSNSSIESSVQNDKPRRNPTRSIRAASIISNISYVEIDDNAGEVSPNESPKRRTTAEDDEEYRPTKKYVYPKGYYKKDSSSSDPDDSADDIQSPRKAVIFDIGGLKECFYCGAMKYGNEDYCCRRGTAFFPPHQAQPDNLRELFFGNSPLAKAFRRGIICYNTLFSMASLQKHQLPPPPHGVPIEKIQGVVDAYPSAVLPYRPDEHAFANFYVFTGKDAVDLRKKMWDGLDVKIIEKIQEVMDKYNDMAKNYRTLKLVMEEAKASRKDDDDDNISGRVRMKIINVCDVDKEKLQGHPGIYKTIESKQKQYIAVFYTASVEQHDIEIPGLIIYPFRTKKAVLPIHYWNSLVDPLCYPMIFPHGEMGYIHKHFMLKEKGQCSYWFRLAEYWKEFPQAMEESELLLSQAEVKQLAREKEPLIPLSDSDGNNEEENAVENDENTNEQQEEGEVPQEEAEDTEERNTEEDEEHFRRAYFGEDEEPEAEEGNEEAVEVARNHQAEVSLEDEYDEYAEPVNEDNDDSEDCASDQEEPVDLEDPSQEGEGQEGDEAAPSDSDAPDSGSDGEGNSNKKSKRIFASQREYLVYQYQQRKHIKNRFIQAGKLGQLYLIHSLLRVLRGRYDAYRKHNTEKVKTTKNKLIKSMERSATKQGYNLGAAILLAQKIAGSPRWLQSKFENAVALSNKLGKIDLFITATCNTEWKEIKSQLEDGQTWADNPFLVNNVFREKMKKLLDVICGKKNSKGKREKGIFGRVLWYSYSIEFQQRGPPHMHLVVSLKRHIKTADQIDKIVQARLPEDPEVRELVEKYMVHKPCYQDPEAYCRAFPKYKTSEKCKKRFPAEFSESTKFGDRHYPEYYRPDDGQFSSRVKNGPKADNRYVVPYNTTLLTAWEGHINVEVVSTLRVVKYIFKYLFKGFDRVLVEAVANTDDLDVSHMTIDGHLIYPKDLKIPPGALAKRKKKAVELLKKKGIDPVDANGKKALVYDELVLIQDMRALTSCEAAWDAARFSRHGCSHKVLEQAIHEENEEPIVCDEEKLEEMKKKAQENMISSKFAAWFKLNQVDEEAKELTFDQIPYFYTFKNGQWVRKGTIHRNIMARILAVNPRRREAFAIRLLCLNRTGATSFKDLRTVNGVVHDEYSGAAKALGLMDDQKEWFDCLKEASAKDSPRMLRRLFVQILTNNFVANPRALYDEFLDKFFEKPDWDDKKNEAHTLHHIASYLSVHGKTLSDYNLPDLEEWREFLPEERHLVDDSGKNGKPVTKGFADKLKEGLKGEQKDIFKEIFDIVTNNNQNPEDPNAFFLQGSGGTGKTVLMKALLYSLQAEGKKVACVAHTGAAATLLPMGTTAHRAFHIPLEVEETMSCQVEYGETEAIELQNLNVVIWDEATMTDRRVYEAVHRLFIKLHPETSDRPFGGVHFIMAGDFKQTLPIVKGVRSANIVDYTLLKWKLWNKFKVLRLTTNRRATDDPDYAIYLEDLGRGRSNIPVRSNMPEEQMVKLPDCLVPSEGAVIEKVFGRPGTAEEKKAAFQDAAILTVDNKTTFDINRKVLALLQEEQEEFLSVDTYDKTTGLRALDPETYHNVTPSGMPPHRLTLKVGAIVMLMRNINVALGLSNGTRLRILEIGKNILRCEHVVKRNNIPDQVTLGKVLFSPNNTTSRELSFTRKQFPIRLAFCMTCNKAQGQTIGTCGLILRSPCFSHGQLYVALSRVKTRKSLFIFNANKNLPTITNNVVFKKVFWLLDGEEEQGRGNADGQQNLPRSSSSQDPLLQFSDLSNLLPPPSGPKPAFDIDELIRSANNSEDEYFNNGHFMETLEYNPRMEAYENKLHRMYMRRMYADAGEKCDERFLEPEERNNCENLTREISRVTVSTRSTRKSEEEPPISESDSDLEYLDFQNMTTKTIKAKKTPVKKTKKPVPQVQPRGFLKLPQIGMNCFANTATQIVNRLWRRQILDFERINGRGEETVRMNETMSMLQKILRGQVQDTHRLLEVASSYDNFDFNDGDQHDSQEYLLFLMQKYFEKVPAIKESFAFESLQIIKCTQCPKEIKEQNPETFATVKTTDKKQNLQYYLEKIEEIEVVSADCCRGTTTSRKVGNRTVYDEKHVDKDRSYQLIIPGSSKYLFVKFDNLLLNDVRVERDILPYNNDDEIIAFNNCWKPIVMMTHGGRLNSGHYTAYVRNEEDKWIQIDADRVQEARGLPDFNNVPFIIFEKDGPQAPDPATIPRRPALPDVSDLPPTVHEKDTPQEAPEAGTKASKIRSLATSLMKQVKADQRKGQPSGSTKKLEILDKDMFNIECEAVVNAANNRLEQGGGVCGLIFKNAGEGDMRKACAAILKKNSWSQLPDGEAVTTNSFKIKKTPCKAKYVIHTAAPRQRGVRATPKEEQDLRMCYYNTCLRASEAKLKKMVTPTLGIGLYGYDFEDGIAVAVQGILLFFELNPDTSLEHVVIAALGFAHEVAMQQTNKRNEIYINTPDEAKKKREEFEQGCGEKTDDVELKIGGKNIAIGTFTGPKKRRSRRTKK